MIDFVNWLADRWWARAILIALAFGVGVTVSWWALGGLLLLAFFFYLVKPPSYKPRCPKCQSEDIVGIILPDDYQGPAFGGGNERG